MKFLFTFLLIAFLSNYTQAQTAWKPAKTVDGVECFYQIIECSGSAAVLLKFNNTAKNNLLITWNEVFDTQSETNVKGWRGVKQLLLKPGITSETNCTDIASSKCLVTAIDASPAYKAIIKSFSFSDITVTKAN